MYTKADAEKAVKEVFGKTLFFEGAGCAECGDVENCRIRTAFHNDKGQSFYLELLGFTYAAGKAPAAYATYTNAGFVDYCYQVTADGEKLRADIEKRNFEYSKAGILEFVNRECGCSFEQIIVTDAFDDYRVHKLNGFNFMEDFEYNPAKAASAREAFNEIDMEIRRKMGARYSQISLVKVGEDYIKVRCYASEKQMREAGLDPDNRYIKVKLGGRKNA